MNMKRVMMIAALAAILGGLCPVTAEAAGAPYVTNTIARQRYPWNGLVDITCKVAGINGTTNGLKLAVAAGGLPSLWASAFSDVSYRVVGRNC